ncbi:SET and MYND domain-containing protein 4-like [Anopheles marshallii]|uniref:SET and MYND domain-containing protein 4-like n=1 Tax=Anopheles marshallii TaxID=1521116 RepID=UPI00237A3DB9|nr:SET and MYND domain-containing protein 4-like [Anopheles marshallii]
MSGPLTYQNCEEIEDLFIALWNKKIRFIFANVGIRYLKQNPVEPLACEVEKFLRTQPYRERLNLCHDGKNNAKAVETRNQGNDMFHPRVKRYIEAIKYYNESIAHAEKGSEERALAYGNRSIICLELHRYEDCLVNIRLARESNYPKRMEEKLKKRENDAKQALKKGSKNSNRSKGPARSKATEPAERELKLSYAGHENMPQVANCLQLQRSQEYGRHVVTNRPLNPGDIVMIEKPFVAVLNESLRYVRCAHCHHEKTFTLIPCEGCTEAMYCSEQCLRKAHQLYHRYECAVIRDLRRISNDFPVMALRTIGLAIAAFDDDLEALKEHLNSVDEAGVNAFTMDWNVAAQKDIYDTVHTLATNQHLRDVRELTYIVLLATIVHQLVMEQTELGSICEEDAQMRKLLFDLILRYLQIGNCNHQRLRFMEREPNDETFYSSMYAMGCCPLISMLNHSCASNLRCITLRDGRCAVLVVRPIAEGGQLFVDYG